MEENRRSQTKVDANDLMRIIPVARRKFGLELDLTFV
jgi:hypothetical protein